MSKKTNLSERHFFHSVKEELNSVTWPTQRQVVNASILILLLVILVILFVAGVDYVLSKLAFMMGILGR